MTVRRLLSLLAVLCLAAAPAAQARSVAPLEVSPDEPVQEKDYGPILANNTSLLHRPEDCRTGGTGAAYCDVAELHVDTGSLGDEKLWEVKITLTWPVTEQEEEEGVYATDYDLYLYDQNEVRVGDGATAGHPENASFDRPETGTYFIVVNNFGGNPQNYKLKATFIDQGKRPPIPKLKLPTPPPDPGPSSTGGFGATPEPAAASSGDDEPEATLGPVLTPGPDGPDEERSLYAVAGRAEEAVSGGLSGWVILGIALGGLAGLSGGAYALRRRLARG